MKILIVIWLVQLLVLAFIYAAKDGKISKKTFWSLVIPFAWLFVIYSNAKDE